MNSYSTDQLKVGIFLPYYNRPSIVFNALHSLSALEYDNWVLYFIDDSGNDQFQYTLSSYCKHIGVLDKIKYYPLLESVQHKQNQGGSRFGFWINTFIQHSDCDIVVILCDDDALTPNYLADLNMFYKQNPGIVWSYCNVYFYNPIESPYYKNHYTEPSYHNEKSTYNLNMYSSPINPFYKLDSSQVSFRSEVFKSGIQFPNIQTAGLDAAVFQTTYEQFGPCHPVNIYGQYKATFSDQLGNRTQEYTIIYE